MPSFLLFSENLVSGGEVSGKHPGDEGGDSNCSVENSLTVALWEQRLGTE